MPSTQPERKAKTDEFLLQESTDEKGKRANPSQRIRIGELLVQEGLLTVEQVERVLAVQKSRHPAPPFGEICIELGFISPAALGKMLSRHHERIPLGELLIHLGLVTQEQIQGALQTQKKAKKKIGTILVEQGHLTTNALVGALYQQAQLAKQHLGKEESLAILPRISPQELAAAVAAAREQHQPLSTVLIEQFRLTKEETGRALSTYYKCPFVEYSDTVTISRALFRGINRNYLKTNYWIPLRAGNNWVEVLIDDPQSFAKTQDIKRLFPGKEIRFAVGLRDDIAKYVAKYIATNTGAKSMTVPHGESPVTLSPDPHLAPPSFWEGKVREEPPPPPVEEEKEEESLDENDSDVVRLVNQIITEAAKQGVSDIHLEPYGRKKETRVRFRVDGVCHEQMRVPAEYHRPIVSRLKVMAKLDIAERRKPQDGKLKLRLPERELELRMATIPTAIGDEDVVLRILSSNEPLPLNNLNLTQRNYQEFVKLLEKPHGMILSVGPTGSGKTTTLHAALGHINNPGRKIWTAEDPVEITQTGLRQVQIYPKIGLTFAAAMRSFLRADPDVIMVGEIRDQETAEVATEASLTGHLVLSTLHTNSAAETITRLLDMGLDPFSFADALQGVIAQRLARTVCQQCKERYRPSKDEYDALAYSYGEEAFAQLGILYDDHLFLYRGRGCETCRYTGYKGRIGLHELLVVTDEIRSLIHSHATVAEIKKVSQAQGMTTLVQDGVYKILQGWTDYNQAKAVVMR